MAKCKYPNEVCANMTVLNGVAYCDSVPCSLKDELPKQTNADRIRSMTDEELGKAMFDFILNAASNPDFIMSPQKYTEWLQSEADTKGE